MRHLTPERVSELQERASNLVRLDVLSSASSLERPPLIQQLSRTALGIDPHRDINELGESQQNELLLVMRSMRDQLGQPQPAEGLQFRLGDIGTKSPFF